MFGFDSSDGRHFRRLALLGGGAALGLVLANLRPCRKAKYRRRKKGTSTQVARVALIDNGSLKPEATLSLRRLATALEDAAKLRGHAVKVDAVSARFADRIPVTDLGGVAADILPGWLARLSQEPRRGRQRVVLLPLLVGPAATLTSTLPDAARAKPDLEIDISPSLVCLCPALASSASSGASQVAGMLKDHLVCAQRNRAFSHILLCDHGSPIARVAAAREAVRRELESLMGSPVVGCCMERREGPEYDFNGSLLEDTLLTLPQNAVCGVALLFLQEGRHAGPGGDIATIIATVLEKRPDLLITATKVLAEHPSLIDLLLQRLEKAVPLRLWA